MIRRVIPEQLQSLHLPQESDIALMYIRCAGASYYRRITTLIDNIDHEKSRELDNIDLYNFKTHWQNALQGLYDFLFLGEGEAQTQSASENLAIFRTKWNRHDWSADMILEGVINTLERSLVVLKGMLEINDHISVSHSSLPTAAFREETVILERFYQYGRRLLDDLPARE